MDTKMEIKMETKTTKVAQVSKSLTYYTQRIEELQLTINEKGQNLRRLQAQRNELNAKVRMLREELQLLQEQGSYVGEIVKAMDKKKSSSKSTRKASLSSTWTKTLTCPK
jgi:uncharacterized coiled-coil DUF342 family protein